MELVIFLLAAAGTIAFLIMSYNWLFDDYHDTKLNFKMLTMFVMCIAASLWTWVIYACIIPYRDVKIREIPIEMVTRSNGTGYQWASISWDDGINLTERWSMIFPETAKMIIESYPNKWCGGIHFSHQRDQYMYIQLSESQDMIPVNEFGGKKNENTMVTP